MITGAGLAFALLLMAPMPVNGDVEDTSVSGRVVNGTSDQAAPAGLEVTLHRFLESGEAEVYTALTDGDGRFEFQDVTIAGDTLYALTTSYYDVLYSSRLEQGEAVELTIYETSSDLALLRIEKDLLVVVGAYGDERRLSVFQVASLVNDADRTFVPDLGEPASMSFVRFSLPSGAEGLDVASDLPGGDILSVGTGFAITAPVPPGSHQVTYVYSLPYEGTHLNLSRSFPMGAGSFQVLLPDGLGHVGDPGALTALPPVDLEGRSYRPWTTGQLASGARVDVEIRGLPQPPLMERVSDALADGPYLKVGIPSAVGLVLGALLLYGLAFWKAGKPTVAIGGPESPATGLASGVPRHGAAYRPGESSGQERRSLIEEIARLDDGFQQGEMEEQAYVQRRQELKARLRHPPPTPG